MEKEKTFLGSRPQYDDFEHLLADQYLTEISNDQERIKKLKATFLLAIKNRNDKTALKLLTLIDKAIHEKERGIAEGSNGDKHLGNASDRADRDFRDWLMQIYWQLPDKKSCQNPKYPALLDMKSWILNQIAHDWQKPYGRFGQEGPKINPISITAFRFLTAAFNSYPEGRHIPQNESEFEFKARGHYASEEEKEKIMDLLRKYDSDLKPEELEEWIKQSWIPYEFKRILAIARTRNGGRELWQKDMHNAELLEPLSPDKRTPAALDLFQRKCKIIAGMDQKVQKLINQMESKDYSGNREIRVAEYVLGEKKIIYNTIFEIIINIKLGPERPEALIRDNFGRAKRHIKKWLGENYFRKVILNMRGETTGLKLNQEFYGRQYYFTKRG